MPPSFRRARVLAATALAGLAVAVVPAAASAQSLQNVSIASYSSPYRTLVLDVAGGSTANGAGVVQWYGYGGGNQRWNVVDQGDGTETIVNQNSGKCLTTDGVPGHQLYQFTCIGSPAQKWTGTLGRAWLDGPGQLRNPASGLVMDVNGGSIAAGTAIITWYDNYADNQYFAYWQLG
jgi:hypothetical protein